MESTSTEEFLVVTARLRRPFATHLFRMAQKEHRSVANMVTVLLAEAIEARDGVKFETRTVREVRTGGGA